MSSLRFCPEQGMVGDHSIHYPINPTSGPIDLTPVELHQGTGFFCFCGYLPCLCIPLFYPIFLGFIPKEQVQINSAVNVCGIVIMWCPPDAPTKVRHTDPRKVFQGFQWQ